MRKKFIKFLYVLGTLLLTLGTVMNAGMALINASTVSSSQQSMTSVQPSSKASSKATESIPSESSRQTANSSSSTVAAEKSSVAEPSVGASSQSAKASSTSTSQNQSVQPTESSSSVAVSSSLNENETQNLAATNSSSTSATPIGQTKIYNSPYANQAGSQGVYTHFHVGSPDGDVAYCYNWDWAAPDKVNGVDYNEYQFYDGMKDVTGNQQKVAEVAAAMEAGYHKNADTGKYEVAPQFQSIAAQSYQEFLQGRLDPSSPFYGVVIPAGYTQAEFEQDVTQSVIWSLDGAPSLTGKQEGLLSTTSLGQAIKSYAQAHPLDQETAYPKNVAITTTSNGVVGNSNPLVMDSKTKLSQPFTLSNYNGGVDVTGLPKGYEIVDANGNKVNQVQSGQTYRVKYVGSGDPSSDKANQVVGNITAKASYQALKDSNYFAAVDQNAAPGSNNPYQNMVNLETVTKMFDFPIIWSSSSSSSKSTSSSSSSSSVASSSSSSSSKSSSSSLSSKSSSSKVSSKRSSSVKSSVKSSSKVSSKKSSSIKSSVKSSSKASSKISSKKSSIVSSSKAVSSSSSSKVASSKSSSSTTNNHHRASSMSSSMSVASSSSLSSVVSTTTTKHHHHYHTSTSYNHHKHHHSTGKTTVASSVYTGKKTTEESSSVVTAKNSTKTASTENTNNTTSAKKAVVTTGVNHSSNSGKDTGHGQGKGEGHGMPQTGEAVATSLVVAGVILLAAAGAVTLRKRN